MESDFRRALAARLIVSAGYETSAIADEWLARRPAPEAE
jgi:hypothetical protein